MRAVFSDEARLQRMLDVEAALARVEARLGLIPVEAAEEITARANVARFDLASIGQGTELVGYPIVPLVKALARACKGDAGRYVHWGATTQDIIDTGLVLQLRDGLDLIRQDLDGIEAALADLARRYRDIPMAGRTHAQHALPITFGFKCALWLAPLQRHRARLARLRDEVALVQFGGAVGTLASLGADGIRVMAALAAELGLRVPPIAWHVGRDGLAEVAGFLGLLTGSLGKIATDVALLMQAEVGEVAEPYQEGRGGSSTMPQKRNPIACEFILACAKNVRQLVPVMLDAMVQDHERATGPWHAEWNALPQAFALTGGALHHARALLEGLVVDPARMRRNLDITQGMISAEAVMMALAPHVGRDEAHHLIAAACHRAVASGRHLGEELRADPEVCAHLSGESLDQLLDPGKYTGLAAQFVDRVRAQDPDRSD
jgi:3-carboxy-cis,cis-muconate cycloisomerase